MLLIGTVIIFLLQGLVLPGSEIRRGLLEWRLHLFCQTISFILIPLIAIAMVLLTGNWLTQELQIGLLYLAILPTTLSTAVVFTAAANGNVTAALVNCALGNLLGLFIVPAIVISYTHHLSQSLPVAPLVLKITFSMLLPLLLGQLLRLRLKEAADRQRSVIRRINFGIVLLFVAVNGYQAVQNRFWESQSISSLTLGLGLTASLLWIVTALTAFACKLLGWERPNCITGIFCASQKTMVAGIPIAQSLFAHTSSAQLSIILLPLILYHFLQIILGGFIIKYLNQMAKN